MLRLPVYRSNAPRSFPFLNEPVRFPCEDCPAEGFQSVMSPLNMAATFTASASGVKGF